MERILVTGASGFIGRATVAWLAGAEYAIRAAVRRPPQPAFAAGVEVMRHPDLMHPVDWEPLLGGVDRIVHLAGVAPAAGRARRAANDEINHRATAQLAAAAARAGIKQFVFVSSIRAQSGPAADHALSENDPAAPSDAYGRSKLAGETAIRAAAVPFTILRPVPLYGPGAKGGFALIMRAARSPWPLPVQDFVGRRSLLGLDNFLSALRFVLSAPVAIGETYIVADPGVPPRLADIVATLRLARGRRFRLVVPMPPDYVEGLLRFLGRADVWERLGGNLRVDPGKLIGAGWRPAHDTRSGLAALVQALPQSSEGAIISPPAP